MMPNPLFLQYRNDLGHEQSSTGHFLINGTFRENGILRNGGTDDYTQGSPVIISLLTDGVVQASNSPEIWELKHIGTAYWAKF